MEEQKVKSPGQMIETILDEFLLDLNRLEDVYFSLHDGLDLLDEIGFSIDPSARKDHDEYLTIVEKWNGEEDLENSVGAWRGARERAALLLGVIYGMRLAGGSSKEIDKKARQLHF